MGKAGSQPSKAASKYIYGFVSSVWVASVTHVHLYLSRSSQELIHPRPLHLDTQGAKELRQGHASGSASTWQVRGANANSKNPEPRMREIILSAWPTDQLPHLWSSHSRFSLFYGLVLFWSLPLCLPWLPWHPSPQVQE